MALKKKKKKARKTHLRVAESHEERRNKARNAMLTKRVQAFTNDLKGEIAKFGIKPDDLTVTVHLQIKQSP